MNVEKSRNTSILKDVSIAISLIISVVSIIIALSVYLEGRRGGSIKVFVPSRYGTLRGTHHSNTSDKILLSFTLHNKGNSFRNITSIKLTLTDEKESRWELKAIGIFDNLKNLNLEKYSLISNPNYSLLTSISLNKNQYVSPNLLFYYWDDIGWPYGEKVFKLKKGIYFGKIIINSIESNNNGYQLIQYESDRFKFEIVSEPFENTINTFTNIGIK